MDFASGHLFNFPDELSAGLDIETVMGADSQLVAASIAQLKHQLTLPRIPKNDISQIFQELS